MGYCLSFGPLTSLSQRVERRVGKGYIGRQCFELIRVYGEEGEEGEEEEEEGKEEEEEEEKFRRLDK